MEEKYSEEYLSKKISEFIKLKHRCQRYWKRLAGESLKIIKEKGLEAEIVDLEDIDPKIFSPQGSETIPIYEDGREINDDILLRFSKQKLPGLYNRFKKDYDKYKTLEQEMIEIGNYFKN